MQLPKLYPARIIRRYKRFLMEVYCEETNQTLTLHCPNTGSMKNCIEPGWRVWYSISDKQQRRYPATLELVESPSGWIGVNTQRANHLVFEGVNANQIPLFVDMETVKSEVRSPYNSRMDFWMSSASDPSIYVEVKSVTLREADGCGYFPDAVSERGRKHLEHLKRLKQDGHRALLFYCVQHTGISQVKPANHLDFRYAASLLDAVKSGVEVYAYRFDISPESIQLECELNVAIN